MTAFAAIGPAALLELVQLPERLVQPKPLVVLVVVPQFVAAVVDAVGLVVLVCETVVPGAKLHQLEVQQFHFETMGYRPLVIVGLEAGITYLPGTFNFHFRFFQFRPEQFVAELQLYS